jgi:hypothetical protein
VQHFDGVRSTTEKIMPDGELAAAEIHAALSYLRYELFDAMDELLGPVWGWLPVELREAASKAGMGK